VIRFLGTAVLIAAAFAHPSRPLVVLAWACSIALLLVEVGSAIGRWLR
jgi:hypothetical protein